MLKIVFMFIFTFLLFFVLTPSIVIFNVFPKKLSKYVIALIHAIIFATILMTGIHLANTHIQSKETLVSAGTIDICSGTDGSNQLCNNLPTGVKTARPLATAPATASAPVTTTAPATATATSFMDKIKQKYDIPLKSVSSVAVPAATAPTAAPTAAPLYVGCYNDSTTGSNRALPNSSPNNVTSVAECQQIAIANGASIFGLQSGGQCFYGNSLSQATQYGPASGCATLGGFNTNQLYLTQPYQYKGCYKDTSTRAIPNQTPNNVTSIADCQQMAMTKGAQLFGVQDGGQCFLGNNLSQATQYGQASGCAPLGNAWTNQVYSL